MTHNKPKKKLTLNRETVRRLERGELTRARGGQGDAVALDTETTCVTTHLALTTACGG